MDYECLEAEVQQMLDNDNVFIQRIMELHSLRSKLIEQKNFNSAMEDQLKSATEIQLSAKQVLNDMEQEVQQRFEEVSAIRKQMYSKIVESGLANNAMAASQPSAHDHAVNLQSDITPIGVNREISSADEQLYQLTSSMTESRLQPERSTLMDNQVHRNRNLRTEPLNKYDDEIGIDTGADSTLMSIDFGLQLPKNIVNNSQAGDSVNESESRCGLTATNSNNLAGPDGGSVQQILHLLEQLNNLMQANRQTPLLPTMTQVEQTRVKSKDNNPHTIWPTNKPSFLSEPNSSSGLTSCMQVHKPGNSTHPAANLQKLADCVVLREKQVPPLILSEPEPQTYSLCKNKRSKQKVDSKPYKCLICNVSYASERTLNSHLLYHVDNKRLVCTICKASFRQKKHLSEHMDIHNGNMPHKCPTCEKAFKRKSNLNEHVKRRSCQFAK